MRNRLEILIDLVRIRLKSLRYNILRKDCDERVKQDIKFLKQYITYMSNLYHIAAKKPELTIAINTPVNITPTDAFNEAKLYSGAFETSLRTEILQLREQIRVQYRYASYADTKIRSLEAQNKLLIKQCKDLSLERAELFDEYSEEINQMEKLRACEIEKEHAKAKQQEKKLSGCLQESKLETVELEATLAEQKKEFAKELRLVKTELEQVRAEKIREREEFEEVIAENYSNISRLKRLLSGKDEVFFFEV